MYLESGWSNNNIGFTWLKEIFELGTRTGRPRLLLFDGHRSHLTAQFINFAVTNSILMVCLPPYTSHLLQPLNVGVFGPKAHYLSEEMSRPCFAAQRALSAIAMLEYVIAARPYTFTSWTIRSAWKKTGIELFGCEKRLSELFFNWPIIFELSDVALGLTAPKIPCTHNDVFAVVDCLFKRYDYSFTTAEILIKLVRGFNQHTDNILLLKKEVKDLQEAVAGRKLRRERLPGLNGLFLDGVEGCKLADKLAGRQTAKDKAFRYREVCCELLVWLKERGLID